ncbi:hypothetical protein [Burkholderia ubonensis]|uniref:hypothetical protein n=1 Tax=Burkholderia ubonensis TaxID=101571 RepID=UPI0038CD721F
MLNLCAEWEWIDRVPKLARFEEPDVRVRWETPEVIATMINALRLPWMMVLKELGGWETIAMVQKYAHLAPSHLAQHAGTVAFWAQPVELKEKTPVSKAA